MKKHANIPVFIPHLGCPNQCVFCNQRSITGKNEFDPARVDEIIKSSLATIDENTECEIAFFGGSFTGIDMGLMLKLLEIAHSYVKCGRVKSIRCSTRPDYINVQILDILKTYGVSVIELGLQSADDQVLSACKRGHDFFAEEYAVKLIKQWGFELVGQMMIGLPGSTLEKELKTAEFICNAGADGARIYPTVVFRDTELCSMAKSGEYIPISEDEAIIRTAKVLRLFNERGVKVIRVGLCASENLSNPDSYFAGPNHSALGELCENQVFYEIIFDTIQKMKLSANAKVNVSVPNGALSKAIGQKKKNKLRLTSELSLSEITFTEDQTLKGYDVRCEERKA